ncbi:molecular chaperone DnaJ [Lactococcus nasutitermitis]|uniref:Chaperone protein DnaJ n=1 Tax=Lactococcus nasutitermitis TaxID=1652957 RepID=A0ABV9JI89_9LACT|nr:molecular chaperone DnaJ [Lactococcus nasutitermitis]
MNNNEFYERLGVDKNASQDEIKKAYRKMSKKYHPDVNKEADAEDKYKDVQEAYETLSDEQKRAAYDQYGAAGANGFGGGAGGFGGQGGFSGFSGGGGSFGGFEDIFSSFFGGGGGQVNPTAPQQGDDLQYRINLKFEEAIFGVEKEVKYNREELCHTCGGNGAKPGTQPITCQKCGGRGHIQVVRDTPLGRMSTNQTCDVCHGTGKEIKEPCTTCRGIGHEKATHTVKVTVPAGVESGQQMRLQGQGDAGVNGGPYGDLYVRFQVAASDKFERDGSEIFYKMPVEFVQAALGDEVEVPTVHGNVKLKVPAGTQTGANFRLKGKGAPKLRGGGNGDQHVIINIVTPKTLNPGQKEALQAFAKASGISVDEQKAGFFDKLKKGFE